MNSKKTPELLAPAGSIEAFDAAINAGADAVYFGLGAFNARSEAANLSLVDLDYIVRQASLYKVQTYLTLNTLLANHELQPALELASRAYAAGVDAVILQDKGLALALKQYLPDLALHGSTQMSLTQPEALYEAKELGLSRVILPRELSYKELELMQALANELALETEIFVHGALCVCASGQCALSYFNGGRSANRGACAQACRLHYTLELDGTDVKNGALLSPKDQALVNDLRVIAALGIDSIKIEGRRRSASYVGSSTYVYRNALDNDFELTEKSQKDLLLAFNRGGAFTRNWFGDERNAGFLSGAWPGSHGLHLGTVVEAQDKSGKLIIRPEHAAELQEDLVPGSVVTVRDPYLQKEIASAPIGKIDAQGGLLEIKAFHPQVLRQINRGLSVYLMQSERLNKDVANRKPVKKYSLDFCLHEIGSSLHLIGSTDGNSCTVPLIQDSSYPAISEDRITQALGKLGSTVFTLGEAKIDTDVHLALSSLNQARRSICEELEANIVQSRKRVLPAVEMELNDFTALKDTLVKRKGLEQTNSRHDRKILYFQNYKGELGQISKHENDYDQIVVPLAYLAESSELFEHLLDDKSGRYALSLPIFVDIENHVKWTNLLKQLCSAAPRLLYCSVAGAKRWAERIPNLAWTQDSGSHIMNSLSALWSLTQGSACLSLADELSTADVRALVDDLVMLYTAWGLDPQTLTLEVQVSGLRRAMYCRHCNLGHRRKNCSACQNKDAVLIQTSNGLELKQIFHPEADCCIELLINQEAKNEANLSLAKTLHSPCALQLRYNSCL